MALASVGTYLIGALTQDAAQVMFVTFTGLSVAALLLTLGVNLFWSGSDK
jgi:hypothetical protein